MKWGGQFAVKRGGQLVVKRGGQLVVKYTTSGCRLHDRGLEGSPGHPGSAQVFFEIGPLSIAGDVPTGRAEATLVHHSVIIINAPVMPIVFRVVIVIAPSRFFPPQGIGPFLGGLGLFDRVAVAKGIHTQVFTHPNLPPDGRVPQGLGHAIGFLARAHAPKNSHQESYHQRNTGHHSPKISKDPKTQAPPIGISLALFGENGKV